MNARVFDLTTLRELPASAVPPGGDELWVESAALWQFEKASDGKIRLTLWNVRGGDWKFDMSEAQFDAFAECVATTRNNLRYGV